MRLHARSKSTVSVFKENNKEVKRRNSELLPLHLKIEH